MSTESTGSSGEGSSVSSALDAILKRLDQLEAKIDAISPPGAVGTPAVAQLGDPEVQAGLGRILERLDKVEAMIEAMGTFGQRLPALGEALGRVASQGYEQAKARGIDPVATGQRALELGLTAAQPQTLDLLEKLLAKQGTLLALLEAADGLDDDQLATVGTALVETWRSPIPMAGPLRALFAMGDPDIMRTIGFSLEFAKKLGSKLGND